MVGWWPRRLTVACVAGFSWVEPSAVEEPDSGDSRNTTVTF